MQGFARGGLPGRPGQFQPGDGDDRPGDGRRHLYRADHARSRGEDHRCRAARRGAADHGRPDRAQHRDGARPRRHVGAAGREADRRLARGHRQGRGPRAVPPGDGPDRPRTAREPRRQVAGRGQGSARRARPAGRDPALLHAGRHRRGHRLQQGGVRADRRLGPRRLADRRGPDRPVGPGLEGV